MKKKDPHVIWKAPGTVACLFCGENYEIALPAPMDVVTASMKAFDKLHKSCRETERGIACSHCFAFGHVPNECPRTHYEASWRAWLRGPDTGTSSKAICRKLSGGLVPYDRCGDDIPYDPADFGRCHRLLHAIPGWRARIGEMRDVPQWAPFVDAWDELEALYCEELPSGNAPKLYARMQQLRSGASRQAPPV